MKTILRYFRVKVLISSLLLALVAFAIILVLILSSKPDRRITGRVTAIVNIIPAPSPTSVLAMPTQVPTATSIPGDARSIGELGIGSYVQISGTGGTGLRLRVDASLEADVRLLGAEAEVFEVKGGPVQVEGYTWWYLVGPYDATRHGWAVSDYLLVVQNP